MERRLVPVLRGLVISMTALFVLTHVPAARGNVPSWVTAILTNGVYVVATSMVLLRAVTSPKQTRVPWLLVGAGLCSYTIGTAYSWIHTWDGAVLPFPSPADAGWLFFYPLAYAGTLLFTSRHVSGRRVVLDGTIAGLGGAALFSAGVVDFLVGTTGAGDLADTGYVTLSAGSSYQPGGLVDVLYLTGLAMVGLSAWQADHPGPIPTERNRLGWSILFASASLAVLVVATRIDLSNLTVGLSGMTLAAVVLRIHAMVRDLERLSLARHTEARCDALTGLANRRSVLEHLDILLAAPRRDPIALLLLDLNRFKEVNDTYGHQAGDNLLEQAARRLAAVTRDGDLLARLGGDEFVVVVSGPNVDERAAVAVADRIRQALRETFIVEDVDMTIDVSIGVALAHGDSNQLFQQADIAMYHAKRAGGGHAVFDRIPAPPPVAAAAHG